MESDTEQTTVETTKAMKDRRKVPEATTFVDEE
jgi:hypothetical protein